MAHGDPHGRWPRERRGGGGAAEHGPVGRGVGRAEPADQRPAGGAEPRMTGPFSAGMLRALSRLMGRAAAHPAAPAPETPEGGYQAGEPWYESATRMRKYRRARATRTRMARASRRANRAA